MTTITAETTLGTMVTEHPQLARELERRGLDYCCGGQRRLDEACRAAGLDPDVVAAELATTAGPGEAEAWAAMGPVELVDHIEQTHHRYLRDELPRIDALLDKVVGVHGERHPELATVQRWFGALRAELEPHLDKEERVLFPAIRALATSPTPPEFPFGSVATPISVMTTEHDHAGEVLTHLRDAANDYRVPEDGCASYRACYDALAALEADTHLHVHKENNVLFPAVLPARADPDRLGPPMMSPRVTADARRGRDAG